MLDNQHHKPLLRWTIGNVSELGFQVLETATKSIQRVYKDEFDYLICYNNLNGTQVDRLKANNIDLLECFHFLEMEYAPLNETWKFYPPRVRMESHEIIMDNDIVIFKRIEGIDRFLKHNNATLLYEGKYGLHGRYPVDIAYVNSGIFGLPPHFDFAEKIRELQQDDVVRSWDDRHDDQGLVGSILSKHPRYFWVYQYEIPNCDGKKLYPDVCGYHFTGINRVEEDLAWNEFKKRLPD